MQQYTVNLCLQTALHVSGGISTHHQELISLSTVMPDTVDTVIRAHDDGWRYHPKHVEQFADIN